MSAPAISVVFDFGSEEYVLMATSYGRSSPAGPRILRAAPHPDVQWRHIDEASAEADAKKLRAYFDGLGRGPSRTKIRQAGD